MSTENAKKYRQAQDLLRKGWCRSGSYAVDSRGQKVPPISRTAVARCVLGACGAVGADDRRLYNLGAGESIVLWNDYEAADVEEVCSFLELAALVEEDEALT